MTSCLGCGKCCYWKDSTGYTRKCKHLVRINKNKTICRVFSKRLGTIIAKEKTFQIRCAMREDSAYNYYGCPLNELHPDKEICPWDKEE
jgi:hypothetical protein